MPLFGEKKDCLNCGRSVRKPNDPSEFLCPKCGQPGPWASPDQVRERNVVSEARTTYRAKLEQLVTTAALPPRGGRPIDEIRSAAQFDEQELLDLNLEAFSRLVAAAVADDILTPDEHEHLDAVLAVRGNTWPEVQRKYPSLAEQAFVSSINGGALPIVTTPRILAKRGEIVHYECSASLMREVAVRQYQGGYSGFSIPIGKTGVRYRVGA